MPHVDHDEQTQEVPEEGTDGLLEKMDCIIPEPEGLTLEEAAGPPPRFRDPAQQEEYGYLYEPMDWQGEPDPDMETVVTPLLDGEAVMTLLARSERLEDYAWEADRLRLGMQMVFPDEAKKLEQIYIYPTAK